MPLGDSGSAGLKASTSMPQMQTSEPTSGTAPVTRVSRLLSAESDERAAGGCGVERTDAAANGDPGGQGERRRVCGVSLDQTTAKEAPQSGRASSPLRRNNPSCPCVL